MRRGACVLRRSPTASCAPICHPEAKRLAIALVREIVGCGDPMRAMDNGGTRKDDWVGDAANRRLSRDEIVAMASELIAIPSPTGTEATIMAFVTDWCDRHGLPYEVFTKNEAQPNVVISIGNDNGPTLVMNGHLDTVPVSDPDSWTSDPTHNPLQNSTPQTPN